MRRGSAHHRPKRADAFGAVFAGAFHLSCQCGKPDCPVAAVPDARATSITVHVVADHTTLTATPDPALHGNGDTPNTDTDTDAELEPDAVCESSPAPAHSAGPPAPPPEPGAEPDPEPEPLSQPEAAPQPPPQPKPAAPQTTPPPARAPHPAPAPQPAPAAPARPAVILGLRAAVLPPAVLAEVLTRGAKVRTVADPRALPVTPGYRPTTAHDEFVRCRDLTCRVPGCDRPALDTDLDHSDPWPAGPTHPATSTANAACTTCSKHSGKAGPNSNNPTAPCTSAPPPGTPTPHDRSRRCCSPPGPPPQTHPHHDNPPAPHRPATTRDGH
ncbi:hypothetical protein ACEWX3_22430 [Mycobacterium sp. G7A2]|uniref:hypothetical protein n=1 Tax=Mycobacterium sp. G7A2 TaxID=3317307 RepID=UPI0035A86F4E